MYNTLAKTLINKGLITQNTELEGMALTSDTFHGSDAKIQNYVRVQNFKTTTNSVTFHCTDIHGRGFYAMSSDDVWEIEGMEPKRFAQCYNLKEDGSYKKPGKKRGRKSKNA